MISAGVLIIALRVTVVYMRLIASSQFRTEVNETSRRADSVASLKRWVARSMSCLRSGQRCLSSSHCICSSIRHSAPMKGIMDSLQTFAVWTRTGLGPRAYGDQYITWLVRLESPLLFLGATGAAIVVLKPKNSFALFCALWALVSSQPIQ